MEPILGMIYTFAGNFAPDGYAMCDGQLLEIAQNMALFSIIGTTYGGDGIQKFALPKLTGPGGTKSIIATRGIFPSRQ
jgi:microcystin-dependent protein